MVDIVEDYPIALFAVATTNEIVNTAVLNGVDKIADISVQVGLASGQLQIVTDSLTCLSNNSSVLSVNDQCSRVYAGSLEAPYANITISHMGVSVDVIFKIWFPQMPMQVILSDGILNVVEIGGCTIYQKATITVLSNFTSGDSDVQDVVVTEFVTSDIISTQQDIANVTDGVVYGVGMGETDICIERNGTLWGCASVSVSEEPVAVYDIATVYVNDIVVSRKPATDSLSISIKHLLEIERDQAGIVTAVRYTDGTIFMLEHTVVLLQSLVHSVVDVNGTFLIARSSGEAQLNVTWLPDSCTSGAHSLVDISLSLDNASDIIVSPFSQILEITPPSDAARYAGVPIVHTLTVELLYNNTNRTLDVTNDIQTVYNTTSTVLVINHEKSGASIVASNSTTDELANVTISHQSLSITKVVTIRIIRAQRLVLTAHPYPLYNGSYNTRVSELKLISNTGIRQQAALRLTLELSNNIGHIVTTHASSSLTAITSNPPGLLDNTIINQIQSDLVLAISSGDIGNVTLKGVFASTISTGNVTIELPLIQEALSNFIINPFPSDTLRGEYDLPSMPMSIDVFFDDGTIISNLVPSNLPGLFSFTSLNSDIFTVTEHGEFTPLANSHYQVTVMITAIAKNIQHQYSFFVNLDPSPGDVDLGNPEGTPIVLSQSDLQIPVYVNTNQSYLGAIQLHVSFDPQVLQAVSVAEGIDWEQGFSEYNIDGIAGSIEFGGAISSESVRGPREHIFTLNFDVVATSSINTTLLINIHTITDLSINSSTIGGDTPRLSRAGNATFTVHSIFEKRSVMKRSRPIVSNKAKSHHAWKRQASQCTGSTCVIQGDTNGDGIFDVRDVSYTLIYIVEATLDFGSPRGMQISSSTSTVQLTALDADLNSIIDIADAIFLLKSVFRLVYLLQEPTITPVNQSGNCLLEISVTLTTGTDSPIDDVEVFFDISLPNIESHQNFTSSSVLVGTVITNDKGDDLFGGIVRAEQSSLIANQFIIQINSSIVNSVIGVSVLQVTFDAVNISRPSRTAQSFGVMTFPLMYPHELDLAFNVRGYNFTVFASNGYNSLISSELFLATGDCNINIVGNVNITDEFEDSLSTTEYTVITVSLGIFILGVLVLLITICSCCQNLKEKTFGYQKMMTNDFTQEDYYVVCKII